MPTYLGMYIGINGKTGILSSSVKSQFHKKNSIKIKSQSSSVRSRSSLRLERCFSPIHNGAKFLLKKHIWLIIVCLLIWSGVWTLWPQTCMLSSIVKSQFHKKNSIKIKSQSSSVRSRSSPRSERCFSYHSHWGQIIKTEVDLQQTQKLRLFEFLAVYTADACK